MGATSVFLISALCVGLVMSTPTPSKDSGEQSNIFGMMDVDKDGIISLAEHNAAALAVLAGKIDIGLSDAQKAYIRSKYDEDKDGILSDDELLQLFNAIDTDGSGGISVEELIGSITKPVSAPAE